MEALAIYRNVFGNELKNCKVFLIGGGTSLEGFDFKRLQGKGHTFVINDAILSIPWADSFFTCDYRWVANRQDQLKSFGGSVFLAIPESKVPEDLPCTVLARRYQKGFSENPNTLNLGGHSGFALFNLAVLMGAKEIFLFGYDFFIKNQKRHFHEGYAWDHNGSTRYYNEWANGFCEVLSVVHEKKIKVLNFSENSMIPYFEKYSLDKLETFL